MFSFKVRLWLAALAALLLLAGCATTRITESWQNLEVLDPVASMLVIARFEEDFMRRIGEDYFATRLQERGVNAVASYRVFPEVAELDPEQVEQRAAELGLEAILVVRVLAQERVEEQYRGHYHSYYPFHDPFFHRRSHFRSWHRYYAHGYHYPYAPTLTREATVLRLEASLYRPGEEGLLWSVRTQTSTVGPIEERMDEIARKVVREMVRDNRI
ncbi:hypothetical protein [Geoalkalibacter halelectricus]|uniref:DUF4136 domain-containing protein n=1 Tax=Geoalkalibacter halelectricus TaxID=2847045 RepID=A0ABY5ZPE7_9BACT|nr:hypothetical protein [Geoalkalibacter halelectricus]MDO3379273.1 hypothetical protein [Geoalkalibacter halelectricus]UWZ81030.1 hypothetical protein L9S41_06450 [Geoalkalibacter halelectricus]